MTQNDSYEQVLAERAEKLAQDADMSARDVEATVAVVTAGGQKLGIMAGDLREIVPLPEISILPDLPAWVLGLVQIRGELVSVVDSRQLIGAQATTDPGLAALVDTPGGSLALAVDQVLGLREIFSDEVIRSPGLGDGEALRPVRFSTADLVSVLDLSRLSTAPAMMTQQASTHHQASTPPIDDGARAEAAHENKE